jgi:TolB-like protein/tetratricopeptide (TPR) repeat protein
MSDSPKAVFLSYASQDADAARRICESLRAAGLEVWFDQNELRGGDAWDASIRRQIKDCALFVPIISANTQAREEGYFRREWNLAVNRTLDMAQDKAFLLPVVIDGTGDATARVPDKFRDVQWTRLPGGEASGPFAERVCRLLGTTAAPAAPAPARPAAADARSIAVLPFVNLSRDEDNEYFADGLAEELLNVIAKVRGLRVAARTSSFSFKGKDADIQTIAAKLNVATVLEGSVRKAGKRVRVTAQLINAADGYHLWSETYDRELDDIFAVQDDIAQAVLKELQASLMGSAGADAVTAAVSAATRGRTVDAEAHQLRLQGRHLVQRGNKRDRETAIAYFRRAIAIDADYAAAWADLALALFWRTAMGGLSEGIDDYLKGFGEARETAERALALEPDLAEAHLAMAFILSSMTWDRKDSERAFRRALELAPGDAEVARSVALRLSVTGHFEEALRLSQRAVELDPLNHAGYLVKARTLLTMGRVDEAEATFRKVLELNPQSAAAHGWLCWLLLTQGRLAEADEMASDLEEEDWRALMLVYVRWSQGRREESDRLLADVTQKYAKFFAYQLGQVHAHRGEIDAAFDWLGRAYGQHDPGLHHSLFDPVLAPLRTDPRWPVLMKKIGYGG